VEKWREGYDIVQTVRQTSEADGGWLKRRASQGFYSVFKALSRTEIHPGAADFRLMDAVAVEALRSVRERRRFLRGLIPWLGFRTAYLPYVAAPRLSGRPGYTLQRSTGLALNGILSFSVVPLRLSLYLGFGLAGLALLYAAYILYADLIRHAVIPGWTSLMLVVLILFSAQFVMLGILGEYVATIVEEAKQRPLYAVRERIGFTELEPEADVRLPGLR
jgi:dolichol-phosphate mannosyltransferase